MAEVQSYHLHIVQKFTAYHGGERWPILDGDGANVNLREEAVHHQSLPALGASCLLPKFLSPASKQDEPACSSVPTGSPFVYLDTHFLQAV